MCVCGIMCGVFDMCILTCDMFVRVVYVKCVLCVLCVHVICVMCVFVHVCM